MRRAMGYVVALTALSVVLLVGLFAPAWVLWADEPATAAAEASTQPDPTPITDYDATFTLEETGVLSVVERLTVDVPADAARAGIVRLWDRVDASDERVRRAVDGVDVSLDGDVVPFELSTAEHGRFDVATIGDPDVAVEPGEHVYVISYRMIGAIEDGYDGLPSSFHWDLVPPGWQQDIERVRLTVELPAPARNVQCGIGLDQPPAVCERLQVEGATTVRIRTGALPDHTPVTLRVGLDVPLPETEHLPWKPRYDAVLGQSVPRLGVVLGLSLVAALLGVVAARRPREKAPPFPLTPEPPAGVGPAQAAYLLTGRTDRSHYVASLLYAADHGAVELTRHGDAWTFAHRADADAWSGLDPVTSGIAHLLGGPGSSSTVEPDSVAAGERLATEVASFGTLTRDWARASGHVETVGGSRGLGVLVVLCLVAAGAAATWNPFDMAITGLVPGAFAIAAVPLLRRRATTRRTSTGRDLWSRAGGFERALSAPSTDGRDDLRTAYLPWAAAFGCADQWAARYRTATGHELPLPSYVGGRHSSLGVTGVDAASMVADLDAAFGSAIAAWGRAAPAGGKSPPQR